MNIAGTPRRVRYRWPLAFLVGLAGFVASCFWEAGARDLFAPKEQSTTEIDPARRRQLFISMNDLAIGDVAMIPLVASANVSAVKNDIEGFDASPWDVETWNIADWRRRPAGN